FHYTPKHASWLNMVECEISVLQRQCLGRRIDDPKSSEKRSRHGCDCETKRKHASNGCSQPKKHEPNSPAPTHCRLTIQNHREELLASTSNCFRRRGF